jgi:hypothetical protein
VAPSASRTDLSCSVELSAPQTILNSAATPVNVDTVNWDIGGLFDPATHRIVCRPGGAGRWRVGGAVGWNTNDIYFRVTQLNHYDSFGSIKDQEWANYQAAGYSRIPICYETEVSDGDYFVLIGQQLSGGSLDITNARFQASRVASGTTIACSVSSSVAQTVPANLYTTLTFDSSSYNDGGLWTNPGSTFTATLGGVYHYEVGISYKSSNMGLWEGLSIQVNGNPSGWTWTQEGHSDASAWWHHEHSGDVRLTAGQTLEFLWTYNGSGTIDVYAVGQLRWAGP